MGSEKTLPMYVMHDVDGCGRPTVVKEITHLHFTALTELALWSNRIPSIQELPTVQMSHLQTLHLYDNNITAVGAIRKGAWPALKSLIINHNYFRDAEYLAQGCFPQIQTLFVIQIWGDKNPFTQHCFLTKMQTGCLKRLRIRSSKYCFDRSAKQVLKQRWPHVGLQ